MYLSEELLYHKIYICIECGQLWLFLFRIKKEISTQGKKIPCYSSFSNRIICGPSWGSFAVQFGGNREEELPKKPVGRQSADSWPTGFALNTDYQSADRRPTVGRQVFWGALLHNYQFGDNFWSGDHLRLGIICNCLHYFQTSYHFELTFVSRKVVCKSIL